ncbi:MAG: transcriptional regulator [Sideroxyarcus sp.]|nr:transcriptional regulator [Sideroxyarcus sp.]
MTATTFGLSDALFPKTQQRVLAVLFGNPERSFYTNELFRLVGAGSGAVQRELKRMTDAGLLNVTLIGNQKHYQANRDAPVFEELRSIVIKTFGVADQLRAALLPLANKIEVAFIYGSVAKGTDNSNSDVDLMLIGEGISHSEVIAALMPAEAKVARKINPSIYSKQQWKKRLQEGNVFVKRVQEQAKIFLIGTEHDLV